MNALIFGRRKQGKSTLAMRLALTYHRTVFIFDPNAQFRGLETVETLPDLQAWIEGDGDHGVIVFRPQIGEIEADFEGMAELIQPLGNYALLIDEASLLQGSHGTEPSLDWYMRRAPQNNTRNERGEVVDVTVIQTLHRPADANSICRSLATDQFFFQTQLRRDLDTVEKQFGPQVAATLPTLPRHHITHAYTGVDGQNHFSVWDNPADWYVRINDLQS